MLAHRPIRRFSSRHTHHSPVRQCCFSVPHDSNNTQWGTFSSSLDIGTFIGTLFALRCSWPKYQAALGVALPYILDVTLSFVWCTCRSHLLNYSLQYTSRIAHVIYVCVACGTHSKSMNAVLLISLIFWQMGIFPYVYLHCLTFVCVCCTLQYMLASGLTFWSPYFMVSDYCHCVDILLISPRLHEKVFISFEFQFSRWSECFKCFC
jgi:hypothetical protein